MEGEPLISFTTLFFGCGGNSHKYQWVGIRTTALGLTARGLFISIPDGGALELQSMKIALLCVMGGPFPSRGPLPGRLRYIQMYLMYGWKKTFFVSPGTSAKVTSTQTRATKAFRTVAVFTLK